MNFIFKRIMLAYVDGGVEAGREKYKEYFVNTHKNEKYRAGVDQKLTEYRHSDLIVK